MIKYQLKIRLLTDTTFGRGDGVAGLIDQEVEHDSSGFPFLRGRILKSLLSEECDNLIMVLPSNIRSHWENIACVLFGSSGSNLDNIGIMHVGNACLPEDLREVVTWQIKNQELTNSPFNTIDFKRFSDCRGQKMEHTRLSQISLTKLKSVLIFHSLTKNSPTST